MKKGTTLPHIAPLLGDYPKALIWWKADKRLCQSKDTKKYMLIKIFLQALAALAN